MSPASIVCLFAVCSFFGWVWETLFAILRTGRWDRRGFLFGPVCPIYGVGVVAIVLAAQAAGSGIAPEQWWLVFLGTTAASMALEYATSVAMERAFHAYWWDYSKMPLNLGGRTCVPAGLLFGGGGLLVVYVVAPAYASAVAGVPESALEVASFVIVALLSADVALTVSVLADFEDRVAAADEVLNSRAEAATERVTSTVASAPGRIAERGGKLERLATSAVVGSMGSFRSGVVRRVSGFRAADRPELAERLCRALAALKSRG